MGCLRNVRDMGKLSVSHTAGRPGLRCTEKNHTPSLSKNAGRVPFPALACASLTLRHHMNVLNAYVGS